MSSICRLRPLAILWSGRARRSAISLIALKTPLSVIMNESDSAPRSLADKVNEQAAIMRNQISFYLDRARAAARAGAIGSTTQVAPAIEAFLRTFGKIYKERSVAFSSAGPTTFRFLGERQDFDEMIGNLLDNAGKWAAKEVTISARALEPQAVGGRGHLLFTIDDDGPGLAPELRESATTRGQRLDETKPGSGLGPLHRDGSRGSVRRLAEISRRVRWADCAPNYGCRGFDSGACDPA